MNILAHSLGIGVPILQAPIGSASSPELIAAVSNAGGLGMLAGTWRNADELRENIRQIRSWTGKPFAINLGVHAEPAEKIEICLREKTPVISLFWGDARPYFARIQSAGAKVIATIGTAEEAREAAAAGADVVIAQGWEAGGHVWGGASTLALIPMVVETVPKVPVIAAGGIGDGRGMAAALTLGASGVCLGTRFILAQESLAHPEYQGLVIAARPEDTLYSEVFDVGWPNAPHRVLRNSTVKMWEESGTKSRENDVIAHDATGREIVRYSSRLPIKGMTGDIEAMALYAGQSVGCCRKVQPASAIVLEIMDDLARCGVPSHFSV